MSKRDRSEYSANIGLATSHVRHTTSSIRGYRPEQRSVWKSVFGTLGVILCFALIGLMLGARG